MTREQLCAERDSVLSQYRSIGSIVSCERYGSGHINDTFIAITESGERFIFQRINHDIFKKPEEIMANIALVTEHIRNKAKSRGISPDDVTLTIVKTDDGASFIKDKIGSYWRMFKYNKDTVVKDAVSCVREFSDCGYAFGDFMAQLDDFDASTLYEVIPNFHNTPKRYENFLRVVEADAFGRADSVRDEIEFVIERAEFIQTLEKAHAEGRLPLRVTHNDTKLNNILFSAATGEPSCVIDLDTVMPGYAVNDFGDSIRFGANTAAEDEADLSKVSFSLELYRAYADGYLRAAGDKLTDDEIELLPIGARMMTLECGMRFLTDYLEGDVYFRTSREGHNLDRARNQFALVRDMERKANDMKLSR